ncbi:hypothetical protein K438DRAFT_1989578 [Mycena galopus ATCC 62051]|nr:hypothetical protein K438DRAFT_1989578 [Mycena galopus ATCC 62051]
MAASFRDTAQNSAATLHVSTLLLSNPPELTTAPSKPVNEMRRLAASPLKKPAHDPLVSSRRVIALAFYVETAAPAACTSASCPSPLALSPLSSRFPSFCPYIFDIDSHRHLELHALPPLLVLTAAFKSKSKLTSAALVVGGGQKRESPVHCDGPTSSLYPSSIVSSLRPRFLVSPALFPPPSRAPCRAFLSCLLSSRSRCSRPPSLPSSPLPPYINSSILGSSARPRSPLLRLQLSPARPRYTPLLLHLSSPQSFCSSLPSSICLSVFLQSVDPSDDRPTTEHVIHSTLVIIGDPDDATVAGVCSMAGVRVS